MNIEACDKGTGIKQAITIKNDKGRLSSEDIERMVAEGEKYRDEDNKHKEKLEAKNNLESLVYQTKTTLDNDEMKSKLDNSELECLTKLVTETESWLLDERTKDEYDNKLSEINEILNPIMMKLYSQGGPSEMPMPSQMPSEMPGESSQNPTIDEVD